jgi:16S rRNA (cytosine967-C5)-methyltransferase
MNDNDAGLAARAAAIDLLSAALARRAGLDEALSHPALAALEPRDRAFARAVAMAALRRLGPIDLALDAKLKKPPPERVRQILRIGAAQALVLGVPAHAAVATSVDLAAADRGSSGFKGLVNAVLRALLREPPELDDSEALAPGWLYARWRAAYGEDEVRALATVITQEPATDLTLKDPSLGEALTADLEAEVLPSGGLRTERRGDITGWPGFAQGAWWVQDAAAAIPARLLDARAGQAVLDLCAAPGGKTMQLAATGAEVTAVDRSPNRMKRLSENLTRVGLAAEAVTAEAAAWTDTRVFDAVLLDAPCSATGTFRRQPDVLWAAKPGDIAGLVALQARLLDSAVGRLKPGGRLVYSVCSLETEEGEAQVQGLLARHPDLALEPVQPGEGGSPEASLRDDGTLRILPHHRAGGLDGFFVARFRKA